jgi:all-trans-8'-apo-beta-carotenal 15,15'-oxygenase
MPNLQLSQPETAAQKPSYDRKDWQRGYESQPNEADYWIDDIEGEIPAGLQGTFFRNGPGLLDVNGQRIHHPFDGDGMICAIAISEGRAHFRNRFVRTEGYLAEQKSGKILHRGWLANIFDVKSKTSPTPTSFIGATNC